MSHKNEIDLFFRHGVNGSNAAGARAGEDELGTRSRDDDAITIAAALIHSRGTSGSDAYPMTSKEMDTEKRRFLRNMRGGGFSSDCSWRVDTGEPNLLRPPYPPRLRDTDDEGEYVGPGTSSGGSRK